MAACLPRNHILRRTATLGMYEAFQILGYKPYHMAEIVRGIEGQGPVILERALLAENDRFSRNRPLDRATFDKWLEGYDVLIELASYLPQQTVRAYLDDPDVKFILVERNPDAWVKSVNSFVGPTVFKVLCSFPLNMLKYFSTPLYRFWRLNVLMYGIISGGTRIGEPDNVRNMRENYVHYIDLVKKLIPPERMRVIRLKDGLGWKEVCDYLEKPIPNGVPYPMRVDHSPLIKAWMGEHIRNALFKFGLTLVPFVGAGVYFGRIFL